jgi:pantothenate synthetase
MQPVERIEDDPILLAVAARFGKTRLIDNTVLNKR